MAFQDPEFPPGPRSIGRGSPHQNSRWCRVHEFDKVDVRPKLFGIIEADAINQGEIGDCWLLAAFACVSDFPGHIKDLFSPREYSPDGRYEIRLFDIKQGWTTVVIDDMIPCHPFGRMPCFCQVQAGGGIWPLLLEKAFAKFCGTYMHLHGGGSSWAWQVLTGVLCQLSYHRQPSGSYEEWRLDVETSKRDPAEWRTVGMKSMSLTASCPVPTFNPDQLFGRLAYLDQADCLISASISGDVTEAKRRDGLIETHAYSVLEIQKAHGMCMVKLRNPWGSDEWKGAFSDQSPEWRQYPELAEDLQMEQENDGEFWMRWSDFARCFDSIKVSPGHLRVPKQSRTGGRRKTGLKCAHCWNVMTRVWVMTNAESSSHGQWSRMEDGDHCFMCRRALTGLRDFRPEMSAVPGIDVFRRFPRLEQPEPPRRHEVCRFGPACYRHNPEHFAEYAHPWLGLNFTGRGWQGPTGGGAAPEPAEPAEPAPVAAEVAEEPPAEEPVEPVARIIPPPDDLDIGEVHEMLNFTKRGQWNECFDKCRRRPGLVNARPSGRNWAAIHRAAASGELEVLQVLVEELGADPQLATGDGKSPMQLAERGTAESCAAVVAYLVAATTDAGAEEPGVGRDAATETSRRMLACCKEERWGAAFRVAEECRPCVNILPSGERFAAIHHGARQGNLRALQHLVEKYRADVSLLNFKGHSAFQTAMHYRNTDCARYLRSRAVTSRVRESYHDGSERKSLAREEDVWVEALAPQRDAPAELRETAMEAHAGAIAAATGGDWSGAFAALWQCSGLVDLKADGSDWSLLHLAAFAGDVDVVNRLLQDFRADPYTLTEEGKTPLQLAEAGGHEEVVALLQAEESAHLLRARSAALAEAVGEQPRTPRSATRMIQNAFEEWDKDGNGTIEREEMAQLFQELNSGLSTTAINMMFDEFDANKDGHLDFEEFIAWLMPP